VVDPCGAAATGGLAATTLPGACAANGRPSVGVVAELAAAIGGFATTGPTGGRDAIAGVCGGAATMFGACRGNGTIRLGAGFTSVAAGVVTAGALVGGLVAPALVPAVLGAGALATGD
jgi:hypothetical protein